MKWANLFFAQIIFQQVFAELNC